MGPKAQVRKPRPCLQRRPAFWHKIVPHAILVELKLWHATVWVAAQGQIERCCLWNVLREAGVAVVLAPVSAHLRKYVSRARVQPHPGGAPDRLLLPLWVKRLTTKANNCTAALRCNPHLPHIARAEGDVVFVEPPGGRAAPLQHAVHHDVARCVVRPAGGDDKGRHEEVLATGPVMIERV